MEPSVATREGKGGHQTAEMSFLILHYPGNPPGADHKVPPHALTRKNRARPHAGRRGTGRDADGTGGASALSSVPLRVL